MRSLVRVFAMVVPALHRLLVRNRPVESEEDVGETENVYPLW